MSKGMKSLLSAPGKGAHAFREVLKGSPAQALGEQGPLPVGPFGHGEGGEGGGNGGYGAHGSGKHGHSPASKPPPEARDAHHKHSDAQTTLDPAARHAAYLGPPPALDRGGLVPGTGAEATATRASASLEDLLPSLVRKVGWSGDGRKGTVRMELGAGELAGATLLVHAEEGRVRVHLSAPAGTSAAGWRDRIAERLAARGIQVDDIEVE